jgi:enterobactin synthetase component D
LDLSNFGITDFDEHHDAILPACYARITMTPQTGIPGLLKQDTFSMHGRELSIHVIHFDEEAFHMSAYSHAEIALPEQILRGGPRRRAEFFFGRLAAQSALYAKGAAHAHIGIGAQREPEWPSTFIGSISHTRRHAGAIVLQRDACRGVGLDIESRLDSDALRDVEQIALNSNERIALKGLDAPYEDLVTLAFSAKETFFKAASASAGGFFDFNVMEIRHVDLEAGAIDFLLVKTVSSALPTGTSGRINFFMIAPDTYLTYYRW